KFARAFCGTPPNSTHRSNNAPADIANARLKAIRKPFRGMRKDHNVSFSSGSFPMALRPAQHTTGHAGGNHESALVRRGCSLKALVPVLLLAQRRPVPESPWLNLAAAFIQEKPHVLALCLSPGVYCRHERIVVARRLDQPKQPPRGHERASTAHCCPRRRLWGPDVLSKLPRRRARDRRGPPESLPLPATPLSSGLRGSFRRGHRPT